MENVCFVFVICHLYLSPSVKLFSSDSVFSNMTCHVCHSLTSFATTLGFVNVNMTCHVCSSLASFATTLGFVNAFSSHDCEQILSMMKCIGQILTMIKDTNIEEKIL